MTENIRKFFLPFLYAFCITLGIYGALSELHTYQNSSSFILLSIFVVILLFSELVLFFTKKSRKVVINFNIHDEVNEVYHFFFKFLLPLIYYISLVGFGYYNFNSTFFAVILGLTFVSFFLLFVNTKAFFQHIAKLESKTHYVYDIIKFLVFFTSVDTITNIERAHPEYLLLATIIVFVISFIITISMVWRLEKLHIISIALSGVISVILAGLFTVLCLTNSFNPLQISLGLLFVFYIAVAVIHHILLNSLTRSVILEYIVVLVVVVSVLYGIS